MIDNHKTETIKYAYQRYVIFSCKQYKTWLQTSEVPEDERNTIDKMWSRLMQNGAEGFFLGEAAVPEDEVDVQIVNFFIWIYNRDGWTTFRPYWQILRVTWKNYQALGLDIYFERTEGYSVEKT